MCYCCLYSWEEFFFFFGSWCGGNRLLGSSESLILLFWVDLDDLDTTGLSSHLSIWGMSITPVRKRKSWRLIMFLKPELFLYVHLQCLAVSGGSWYSGSGPIFVMEMLLSYPVWLCPHWFFLSVMYKHHFEAVITVALPAIPFFYILYILSVVAFSQLLQ